MKGYGGWAFIGRIKTLYTSGSECLEKRRGSHVGEKRFENADGKILSERVAPACLYGLETMALA